MDRNHNWFHGIAQPIDRLPQATTLSSPTRAPSGIRPIQRGRRAFYRFLIKLTRGIGGDVNVATIPSPEDPNAELVAAILLWCPPYKRNAGTLGLQMIKEIWIMYQAGILSALRAYGIGGFMRISDVFEANLHRMFKEVLEPRGSKFEECGFVQMVAMNTDPQFDDALKGRGYARQLLQWRVDRHWEECKDPKTGTSGKITPVILDTTTDQGINAYKKLGFEVVNHKALDTGTDKNGFTIAKSLPKEERDRLTAEAKKHCVSTVMIKMPS